MSRADDCRLLTHDGRNGLSGGLSGRIRCGLRDTAALFVFVYAMTLLVGLIRLAQGEAAWNGWLAALHTPFSVGFHLLSLSIFLWHIHAWFSIGTRALPSIRLHGKALSPASIVMRGLVTALVAGAGLIALIWRAAA